MRNVIEYRQPPAAPPPTGVGLGDLLKEWRAPREAVRLGAATPLLAMTPRGDGSPVVLIPGWLAPEASMSPLRWYLRSRNHDAMHWGLGTNEGDPERDVHRLAERLEPVVDERGPVALIGWSLGGVIARELARMQPDWVSQVITYGTPVIGGPTYTPAANRYGPEQCERISRELIERERINAIEVPLRIIFTRRDGVVNWPACIDRLSPQAIHYEVKSTHLSMGYDPSVWLLVAQKLATAAQLH